MGVRRLQSFVENHCPDVFYEVNIEEIAREFRIHHGEHPVIVVDGLSCIQTLYADLDWICGGQLKEFKDLVEHFIFKFKEIGIDLVFFFDGATQSRKRQVWVQRRYNQMKDAIFVIKELRKGVPVSNIDKKYFKLPSGVGNVMYSTAKEHCKTYRSIKECDEEIVNYAVRNNCLAILAQDSDYLIYKQDSYYLSSAKLNLETMTTYCYSRRALAGHLSLTEDELPILATLMGNDVVNFDMLKGFHHRVVGRNVPRDQPYAHTLVNTLADFIRNRSRDQEILFYLPQLSREMFGTKRYASLLEESIFSYDVSIALLQVDKEQILSSPADGIQLENWSKILQIARREYVEMLAPSSLYSILCGLPYEMSTSLEDYREIPASANILQPMRKRIYGLALRENPKVSGLSEIIVNEWCMSGPNSLDLAAKVKAILPSADLPCLLDMWLQDTEVLKAKKLNALAWITSPCLSPSLARLPIEILAPTCVLSYLFNDVKVLKEWEVQVFAAVVVEMYAMNSQDLSKVEVSRVDVRGVHLAMLFNCSLSHLNVANALCGYPIPRHWMKSSAFFDGKLFQSKYLQAKQAPVLVQKGIQENYRVMCSVIL